jgi:hypothetical protein
MIRVDALMDVCRWKDRNRNKMRRRHAELLEVEGIVVSSYCSTSPNAD